MDTLQQVKLDKIENLLQVLVNLLDKKSNSNHLEIITQKEVLKELSLDIDKNKLIGFARAITDYTTNYYLCDVIVDEEYRGEGIGKKIVETLINDEELIHLRALLITKDAKKFYEKFGFYNKEDVMQKDKK